MVSSREGTTAPWCTPPFGWDGASLLMDAAPSSEKARAIHLRKDGVSYGSILTQVSVAKSTLWRWLKAAGLVETQPQRLTELRRIAQTEGGGGCPGTIS